MKSARELLDELNAADEHVRIEAKRASEIGKSVIETVCAYEPGLGGGYLLLGGTPAEDSFWPMYAAEGVPDSDKVQADLASQCASMLLESNRTGNPFICQLLFHHFLGKFDLRWLASLGEELADEQRRAMVQAREVGAIDNSTYRGLNRDSDTLDASKQLRKLCDLGLLKKRGKSSKTYYEPTDLALANWPPDERKSSEFPGKSQELGGKSSQLRVKSSDQTGKSLEPDIKSSDLRLPKNLREKIDRLGGKSARELMVDALLELLTWRELSLDQLAKIIGRSPNHVRQKYLQDLIRADLVRPMVEPPNHPNQTYRATKMIKSDEDVTE